MAAHMAAVLTNIVIDNLPQSCCTYCAYLVGSSKKKTGGLLISSRAIDSRFFSPPDSISVLVVLLSNRPRLLSTSSTY